jgi:hypothetical protein
MNLELVPASADQIPFLGDICHRAFCALHDRFGVDCNDASSIRHASAIHTFD